jgi:beta-aspartyl-peptidase (threonine type)
MKKIVLALWVLTACTTQNPESDKVAEAPAVEKQPVPVLVIHGGAGNITQKRINDSLQPLYEKSLTEALEIGYFILNKGGTSLEAVEAVIRNLEDNPLFNAGKGSVLNHLGEVENDASIMDGTTLAAGAVAGVQNVKNPISLARLVKDSTAHVMLSGTGAIEFAKEQNVTMVDLEYFMTDRRRKQRQAIIEDKHGTVGCVALDKNGNIAAGTSTGGMMHKKWGRIGDSPIIGAGTYANSEVAGVSCTGHGEYFIKNAVAYDVVALMQYKGISLEEATQEIINDKLVQQKASGGLIALDAKGNVSMAFNSSGMFRGYKNADTTVVGLFKN